jgi:4-hydroxy-3-methylbut-2-enyl diphosphate reductase
MRINLAKSAGFCFGVKRALDIAFKLAKTSRIVYILGDIVHNKDVVRQIEKLGIRKIKKLVPVKNKILLIRAHGACLRRIRKARQLGYKIIDATCPMVREIHKIVRDMEKKGYKIIVIGDKRHDEVQGIIGQLKKSKGIIIDPHCFVLRSKTADDVSLKTAKHAKKACVVVQSTQNMDDALKIREILKPCIPDLKFFNTICKPSRTKQEEIKRMSLENDIMLIVGSKNSANTKRLHEISKAKNKKSYWVNSKNEIKPTWFKNVQNVGITAGASTPESIIEDIIRYVSSQEFSKRTTTKSLLQ